MNVRGVGDGSAMRRLAWLFVTTIVAPAMLLSLMALGAFGHRRWTEVELAEREVSVQLPLLAALLDAELQRLDQEVLRLAERCPDGSCPPPAGVLSWRPGTPPTWVGDVPALQSWVQARVVRSDGRPATAGLVRGAGGAPVHGPLTGWSLEVHTSANTKGNVPRSLSAWMAMAMLSLVGVGVIVGLGAASREIAMSRRQTSLVSRVSHELRTPLTSIHLFVEALRSGRLPEERAAECLELLSKETDRLARRIEELLSWARMEAGARRYRATSVAPAEVAREAVDALRSQILFEESADLDLQIELPDGLPDLLGDRDALVEAVLNLLVNAFRHSHSPRRIALSAAARGRMVGLSVRDNGPGIDRRDRTRIFEKFYRTDEEERPPSTSGTGLGLAIVRAIVRAHSGRIELVSAPDQGSTFTLWLPVA